MNILNPTDTAQLHGMPLVLTVKCKKQKDTGEMENVIRGYAPKGAAVAPNPASAPATAPAASSLPPWARNTSGAQA